MKCGFCLYLGGKNRPNGIVLEVRAGKSGSFFICVLAAESGFVIEKGPRKAGTQQRVFIDVCKKNETIVKTRNTRESFSTPKQV